MRILLLIEDNQECRRIVERLEFEGYQTTQAESEDEANKLLLKSDFQLVVIDYQLAGDDFVARLRGLENEDYLYVISLLPDSGQAPQREEATTLADEYLNKPVEPDELLARLVVVDRYLQTLTEIRSSTESSEPIRDSITGAFSKATILELISAEISRCRRFKKPFILALLELDQMQNLRDDYNADICQKAMSQVALKIWATVRAYDLFGRWSDDRFMLLLPETLLSGAAVVAERLKNNISSVPLSLPGSEQLVLTVSMSFVQCGQNDYSSRSEIIASVENMLAKIDKSSGNKTVYSREL